MSNKLEISYEFLNFHDIVFYILFQICSKTLPFFCKPRKKSIAMRQ